MAWIESHQSLPNHPKFLKALRLLKGKTTAPALLGHLHMLWYWALDYAENGDVTRFDVDDLAQAATWDGDAREFVTALTNCGTGGGAGFLERTADGRLLIHDWWDYAGKLMAKRQADAERKRRERAAVRQDAEPKAPDVAGPSVEVQSASSADTRDGYTMSDGRPTDVPVTAPLNQPLTNQPTINPVPSADAGADAPSDSQGAEREGDALLEPEPATGALAICLRDLQKPHVNKPSVLAVLYRQRFGNKYPPNCGRLGALAKKISGEYVALAELIWRSSCPEGDPHDYLEKAVQGSPARRNGHQPPEPPAAEDTDGRRAKYGSGVVSGGAEEADNGHWPQWPVVVDSLGAYKHMLKTVTAYLMDDTITLVFPDQDTLERAGRLRAQIVGAVTAAAGGQASVVFQAGPALPAAVRH